MERLNIKKCIRLIFIHEIVLFRKINRLIKDRRHRLHFNSKIFAKSIIIYLS